MPLYVTLAKYTQEGRQNIDQVSDRYKDLVNLVESKGGKSIATYGLIGEWDILTISEFPDEKAALGVLVSLGKTGRLTTKTLQAVHMEDFISLVRNA
jgi:uncharacterized protein with GYD domain